MMRYLKSAPNFIVMLLFHFSIEKLLLNLKKIFIYLVVVVWRGR